MRQCPRCYTNNGDASQYCERCGETLSHGETSRPTNLSYEPLANEYSTPPVQYPVPQLHTNYGSEYVYNTPAPPAPIQAFPPPFALPVQAEKSMTRRVLSAICRSLLYLFGAFWMAFGVAGITMGFDAQNDTLIGADFLVALGISLIALLLVLILHRKPRMRWWIRLVIFIPLTLIGLIALIIAAAISKNNQRELYVIMGYFLFVYGLITQVIAMA